MTRDIFTAQMGRLLVLRSCPDDIDEYFPALQDIPADLFTAAVTCALKTRVWFPAPAELRLDCDAVHRQYHPAEPAEDRSVVLAQPFTITVPQVGTIVSVTREWKYYDERCADVGWASWWCGEPGPSRKSWHPVQRCDRRGDHDPHEWVSRCACAESNPALVRRRAAAHAKYSHAPAKVGA